MEIEIPSRGYAFQDALVSAEWLANRLDDPAIRIIETNDTPTPWRIPGAIEIQLTRLLAPEHADGKEFASIMSSIGVTPDTQLVFCGDNANCRAAESLWICVLFGHTHVTLLEGGREKWLKQGRELTMIAAEHSQSEYDPLPRDDFPNRASLEDLVNHAKLGNIVIDVRSEQDYESRHIEGATNVFWQKALEQDTFKSYDELMNLYENFGPDEDVILYGEGGTHTWFVLKYLLGFPNVRYCDATSFPER